MHSEPAPKAKKLSAEMKREVEAIYHQRICEAAYYLAEKRGFKAGDELADWLEAERLLNATRTNE